LVGVYRSVNRKNARLNVKKQINEAHIRLVSLVFILVLRKVKQHIYYELMTSNQIALNTKHIENFAIQHQPLENMHLLTIQALDM